MKQDDIANITMGRGEWGKIRAYATVELANGLSIRGIRLIEGSKGMFMGLPSRKTKKDGEDAWEDSVFFTKKEDHQLLENTLLKAYNDNSGGDSKGKSSGGAMPSSKAPTEFWNSNGGE